MADPNWQPTRQQVADLISLTLENDDTDLAWRNGYEAGYRARVAEENAAYPPERVFSSGQWVRATRRREAREEADRLGREPRPGDFPGGLPLPPPDAEVTA